MEQQEGLKQFLAELIVLGDLLQASKSTDLESEQF